MSRHGYSEDLEWTEADYALFERRVKNSIDGRRGQKLLRDLLAALDAMPVKELAKRIAVSKDGARCCALGCVAKARGIDCSPVIYEDDEYDADDDGTWTTEWLGDALDISGTLAAAIAYENDEGGPSYWDKESDAERWARMRRWVAAHIHPLDTAP